MVSLASGSAAAPSSKAAYTAPGRGLAVAADDATPGIGGAAIAPKASPCCNVTFSRVSDAVLVTANSRNALPPSIVRPRSLELCKLGPTIVMLAWSITSAVGP